MDTTGSQAHRSREDRYAVGIDVAKQAHVVCALRAPSGPVPLPPTRLLALREG